MHAEYLHTYFDGHRNMNLFSEGGIAPSGECWVTPTEVFMRIRTIFYSSPVEVDVGWVER